MRHVTLLLISGVLGVCGLAAAGCGDDDGVTPGTDAGADAGVGGGGDAGVDCTGRPSDAQGERVQSTLRHSL